MATKPTSFRDDSLVRSSEAPGADWTNGMNWAGSNAPGIGINMEIPNLVGTPEQFTLLDQKGLARDPQKSAQIGHEDGDSIRFGVMSDSGDGVMTPEANADLLVLATGWAAAAP